MIRPDWNTFDAGIKSPVSCNCGQILHTREAVREHWQRGHFDYVEPQQAATPKEKAADRKQFEYRIVDLSLFSSITDTLNAQGLEGWELAATWGLNSNIGIFKREIQ